MGIRSLGTCNVPYDLLHSDHTDVHCTDVGRAMKLGLIFRDAHIDTFAYSERLGWIRVRCNKRGGGCEYPTFTDGPFNAEVEASAAMRYMVKGVIEQAEGEL